MPITNNDVKLLKSERLTDTDDGGGRATGTAVLDSEMNNLFRDISRLDRTTGRISLRKVFAGVVTLTDDAYLGAHSIITQKTADPRVSVLLFNTESQTDQRAAARSSIESYMAPSATASWELLGDQLMGQRALVAIQREELAIPEVGDVFQLIAAAGNQYVRITSIETTIETFTYQYGTGSWVDFQRRRMVMELSAPLNLTFPGGEATPSGTSATSTVSGGTKSRVLTTRVADAARYYGIRPVVEPIALGALTVKVDSLYSQLVPSTTKENALAALLAGFERGLMLASGAARTLSTTATLVGGTTSRTFIGTGILPGSLTVTINGGVYADDKTGNLSYVSGTNWMSSGFVDYATGELTYNKTGTAYAGAASVTYTPAAQVLGDAVTYAIKIALGNRGYVYTLDLSGALPRPGTLSVSYMVLGKWYELRDNGRGQLTGVGTGTLDFASGAVQLTLEALPDVGSAIVYSYISQSDFAASQHTGVVASAQIRVVHTLDTRGVRPGSLVAKYTAGGQVKTLTDTGVGTLTGDGSGVVSYSTGKVELVLASTPDANTGVTFDFEDGALIENLITSFSVDGSGMAAFTIQGAPLKPGSVQVQFTVERKTGYPPTFKHDKLRSADKLLDGTELRTIADNGAGGWVDRLGTINYSTGQCWLEVEQDYTYSTYTYSIAPSDFAAAAL